MAHDQNKAKRNVDLYTDKIILAPMVRENSLPFRLLCLEYGASLVYTEELIDYKLCECRRLQNKVLGTIDFVDPRGDVVLRTIPEEKNNLILQIGSNNADRAIKAAKLASKDITGLDFNFGCPKSFSLSGGMGAALLERPDQIKELLTKVVENIDLPVTCKIRVLPNKEDTLKLVKMIEQCGVSAIAVHGRTKDQRPRHENQNDLLSAIANIVSIPIISNGGSNQIKCYSDILKFKEITKASSVMIARAAMKNPSIFKSDNVTEPIDHVIGEFLKLSIKYDNFVGNSKYTIQHMLSAGHFGREITEKFQAAGDYQMLCDIFGLSKWFEENKFTCDKSEFYDSSQFDDEELETYLADKRQSLESRGMRLICDNVPYHHRIYGTDTPKAQLMSHLNKLRKTIEIETFQLNGQRSSGRYFSLVTFESYCYLNKSFSQSKKGSEQATIMLICDDLKLIDLREYKSRAAGSYRNIR